MAAIDILASLLSVVITLSALSFLWKENIFYRYIEHIYVGFAAAHALISAINYLQNRNVTPLLEGDLLLIIPLLMGLMLFLRFFKSTEYIARWPLAFLIGGQIGLGIAGRVSGNLINQVKGTILPLSSISNIIIVIGVFTGVTHFIFTQKYSENKIVSYVSKVGRQIILVYLAATFAQVTLTRLTVSAGRILELLKSLNLA
jgi:hypothetical protein